MVALVTDSWTDNCVETGAERRRGLRIRQHNPIKLFEPSSSRYLGGQTCDISASGLRVELPVSAPLRIGSLVCVHVGVSGAGNALANRRSMIPARVVWIDRRFSSPQMTAGVEFVTSEAAHRDAA